jgi:hypothetical protein
MMMAAMILMMSERDGRWSMPRRSCRVRVFGGVCGLRSAARLGCAGVRLQCGLERGASFILDLLPLPPGPAATPTRPDAEAQQHSR